MSKIKDIKWRQHVWFNLLAGVWLQYCRMQSLLFWACHQRNTVKHDNHEKINSGVSFLPSIQVWCAGIIVEWNAVLLYAASLWVLFVWCALWQLHLTLTNQLTCVLLYILAHYDEGVWIGKWWIVIETSFKFWIGLFSRVEMKKWRNYIWFLHFNFFSLFYFFAVSNLLQLVLWGQQKPNMSSHLYCVFSFPVCRDMRLVSKWSFQKTWETKMKNVLSKICHYDFNNLHASS